MIQLRVVQESPLKCAVWEQGPRTESWDYTVDYAGSVVSNFEPDQICATVGAQVCCVRQVDF